MVRYRYCPIASDPKQKAAGEARGQRKDSPAGRSSGAGFARKPDHCCYCITKRVRRHVSMSNLQTATKARSGVRPRGPPGPMPISQTLPVTFESTNAK